MASPVNLAGDRRRHRRRLAGSGAATALRFAGLGATVHVADISGGGRRRCRGAASARVGRAHRVDVTDAAGGRGAGRRRVRGERRRRRPAQQRRDRSRGAGRGDPARRLAAGGRGQPDGRDPRDSRVRVRGCWSRGAGRTSSTPLRRWRPDARASTWRPTRPPSTPSSGSASRLHAELAGREIGVTALCPGIISTAIVARVRRCGVKSPRASRARSTSTASARRRSPDEVAEAAIVAIQQHRDGERGSTPVRPEISREPSGPDLDRRSDHAPAGRSSGPRGSPTGSLGRHPDAVAR